MVFKKAIKGISTTINLFHYLPVISTPIDSTEVQMITLRSSSSLNSLFTISFLRAGPVLPVIYWIMCEVLLSYYVSRKYIQGGRWSKIECTQRLDAYISETIISEQ